MNILIALLTGASSGSLGCLAMQGGLLTSLLTVPLDQSPQALRPPERPAARAIGMFLGAKLAAYTALGALLGAFGAVLHLSPSARAGLMIATGLFMVANGLRLLIPLSRFRHLQIGPPAFIRRFIRRRSGQGHGFAAPLVLGTLTVLLPCGVAQAMMATALGSGDPWQGATILFAFTLGSTPAFFAATYLATRLSGSLLRRSTPLAALLLMALGFVPLSQGFTLAGVPLPFPRWLEGPRATPPDERPGLLTIRVGDDGYTPTVLHLRADREVTLTWSTEGTDSCARSIVLRRLNYQVTLPSRGRVPLTLPPQRKGTVLDYSCSMGMFEGRIIFDQE
jgi:uncharacterized protein